MNAILHYYFRIRIDAIQTSQTVSVWEAITANVINKEILEVFNTSFYIKTKPELLKSNKLIDITQSKMEKLLQHIITSQETQGKDEKSDDIMVLAISYFNMGLGYCDTELQKLDIGKAHFTTCLELLKGKELEPKAIITVIKVLNELHTISYKCKQSEESCSFLDTAIELYSRYTKEEIEYPAPINLNSVLGKLLFPDDEEDLNSKIALENLQLTTLLNMSRLYNENPRDRHKFVIYVHNILKQILNKVSIFYVTDWAITSTHLSRYFVRNRRFTEGRNHIITAEYLIKKLYQYIETINDKKKKSDLYKNICEAHDFGYNTVVKFWGLYGTDLLIASADELLPREKVINSCEENNSKSESFVDSEENLLIFSGIEKKHQLLKNCIAPLSDKCVSNLKNAKAIFMEVRKCFRIAKEYFTIEKHIVDFIIIETGRSKMYNSLATFYKDKNYRLYFKGRHILIELKRTLDSMLETCSALFNLKFNIMNLKEILEVDTIILNMNTEHLLVNVEQQYKTYTENKNKNITEMVDDLIYYFQRLINELDIDEISKL